MKNPYEQFYKNKLTKIFYPESLVVKLFCSTKPIKYLEQKYKGKKLKISHFTPINLTKYQRTYRGLKKIVMNCDGGFPEQEVLWMRYEKGRIMNQEI